MLCKPVWAFPKKWFSKRAELVQTTPMYTLQWCCRQRHPPYLLFALPTVSGEPRDGSINSKTRRRRHLSPVLSHKPQYDWARCIQPCAKMNRTATIGHLKAKEDDRYSKEHAFDRSSVENLFRTVGHYSFRKVYRTPALCIDFDL